MKISNKIIIAGSIVCAFCLGLLFALFIRVSNIKQNPEQRQNSGEVIIETENNISESPQDKEETQSYTIKLEGSTISAYVKFPDGRSILWNSTSVPPALSQKDKEILKEGITTDSFEELCLYFEAYSS